MTTSFEAMRKSALEIEARDINIQLSNDKQVYASIVDMRIKKTIATLTCMFDGTVSILYSNGRMDIGLGSNPNIKKAAMTFLLNAGQCLSYLETTNNYDISYDMDMVVYLKAMNGTYIASIDPNNPKNKVDGLLNLLIQKVLSEVKQAQI